MTDLTGDLLAAVVAASSDRKALALRVLRGEPIEPPTGQPSAPLLLGMTGAAKLLGVSRATLWRIIQSGRIEKVELFPGSYRLRRADIEQIATARAGGPP